MLSRKTKARLDKKWLKGQCPICGEEYQYLPDYKPMTCGKFECLSAMAMEKSIEPKKAKEGGK